MRTRVKICGITNRADAELTVSAGADALGLNFYPPSPRYLEPDAAVQVADARGVRVVRVTRPGVDVPMPAADRAVRLAGPRKVGPLPAQA